MIAQMQYYCFIGTSLDLRGPSFLYAIPKHVRIRCTNPLDLIGKFTVEITLGISYAFSKLSRFLAYLVACYGLLNTSDKCILSESTMSR